MKNLLYLNLLICFLFFNNQVSALNKIVVLISPARSLSTVFLRMVESRGDFEVMLEPTLQAKTEGEKNEIASIVLKKAESSNIFIKEPSGGSNCFLRKNIDFIKRENVFVIFLARNPHHALISRYKKDKTTINHFGYSSLYNFFTTVKDNAFNKPSIILSEDLYTNTEPTYKKFCDFLNIPYKKEALEWSSFEPGTIDTIWGKENFSWHLDAISSTGFHTPTSYKLDSNGNPSFEEVDVKDRTTIKDAYEKSLLFYNQLLEEKDFLLNNHNNLLTN